MNKIYRESEDGKMIKGIGLPAFIHNAEYHLVTIKIYEDGAIDCWGLVGFEEFKKKIQEGWVVTQIPKGAEISRHHSFYGSSDGIQTYIEESEFVKEVADTLNHLQGKRTSSERCHQAFTDFLESPSKEQADLLKVEYESIPDHLKRYVLGDMDGKDSAILEVISNNGSISKNSLDTMRKYYLF